MTSRSLADRYRNRSRCLLTILILILPFCSIAQSGLSSSGDDLVSLNFSNADISAVAQAISKVSGRNFVIDPRVKGTVNIVTSRPVPPAMTYSILLSALRLQGFTVIEGRDVTKIVPEADAKLHAVPLAQRGSGAGDRLQTRVFQLRNESASQLVPIIRPMVSPNNTVAAYSGNNALVVTDYAENIERIGQIIDALDVPQGDIRVFPLQHAAATDLAATIMRLMSEAGSQGQGGDTSQRLMVTPDTSTNSLLVRSENRSKINAVRQLVSNLDKPGASGNIHVVYLKNAEAVRVAQTLRAVLAGDTSPIAASAPLSSTGAQGSPTAPGGAAVTASQLSSAPNGVTLVAGGSAPMQGGVASGYATSTSDPGGRASGMIQADPTNNALIITAPDAIYNNLRHVIDQLDRRRAQVYIEALIAEVSNEKAAEIGIQWQAGRFGSNAFGGTNFSSNGNNIYSLASGLNASSGPSVPGIGLNLILGGGSVSIGGQAIPNLHLLARFLETDNQANILSTPTIVTLDNEEARIVVGNNLPFVTGQFTTNTGGGTQVGNPFQTIERRDVGLTLKVKPQISEGGTVKLQIYQEASSVLSAAGAIAGVGENSGPVTRKRAIESTVLVDDGAVVALGGLMEDTMSKDDQKVPLLGDAPLVGGLFRYGARKRGKTSLLVFLRPVVMRDAASYQALSGDRYDYILNQQRGLAQGLPEEGPRLPQVFQPPMTQPQSPVLENVRKTATDSGVSAGSPVPVEPNAVTNSGPRRDVRQALLNEAKARLERGDLVGTKTRLRFLLSEDPNDVEARSLFMKLQRQVASKPPLRSEELQEVPAPAYPSEAE